LLNENSRGSISGMVKPDTGQANFSEKTMRLSASMSPRFMPPAFLARGGLALAALRLLRRRGRFGAGFGASANSAMARPSASSSAVWKESARRVAMSPRTTMRSTTTSMSCLSFLSSAGASAISWKVPSILTRWKPRFWSSASSFRYSPFRPRTIGASR
jgi:hypothetical protein